MVMAGIFWKFICLGWWICTSNVTLNAVEEFDLEHKFVFLFFCSRL